MTGAGEKLYAGIRSVRFGEARKLGAMSGFLHISGQVAAVDIKGPRYDQSTAKSILVAHLAKKGKERS
jgi:hypothetical protein